MPAIMFSRPDICCIFLAYSSRLIDPSFTASLRLLSSRIWSCVYPAALSSSCDIALILSVMVPIDSLSMSDVSQPCLSVFSRDPYLLTISSIATPLFLAVWVRISVKNPSSIIPELMSCFQPELRPSPRTLFRASAEALIISPKALLIPVRSSLASPKSPTRISQV